MSKYPHYINMSDHIDDIWIQLKEHFLSYKEEPLFVTLQKLILRMPLKNDTDSYSFTFGLKFTRDWKWKIEYDDPDIGTRLYTVSFYTRFARVNYINNNEYGMVMYDIVDKGNLSNVPYDVGIDRFTLQTITTKGTVSAAINSLIANYDTGFFKFVDANTKKVSDIELNIPIKFDMIDNGSHLEDDEIIKLQDFNLQKEEKKEEEKKSSEQVNDMANNNDNTMYIELDQYRDKIWDSVRSCFINDEEECQINFDSILLPRKSGPNFHLVFHVIFMRKTDNIEFSGVKIKESKSSFLCLKDSCIGCFYLQASLYKSVSNGIVLRKKCNVTSKDDKYIFRNLNLFGLFKHSSTIITSKQDVMDILNTLFESFKTGYFRFRGVDDGRASMVLPSHPVKFKPFSKITEDELNLDYDVLHATDLKSSNPSIGKMEFNLVTKKELPDELNINGVLYRKVSTDM